MRIAPRRRSAQWIGILVTPALFATVGIAAARSVRSRPREPLPEVTANDNRVAAGSLNGGVLTVHLVVAMARWHPEGDAGPYADVETFAEEGGPPSVPGPLLRVREGTIIDATIRNALRDSTITLHGLQTRPAVADDSVRVAPGESRHIRFLAGAPGTYLYRAIVGRFNPDSLEREQLAGALVIDPVGARADDRVFVINIWGEYKDSVFYRNALTINGKSWPHTERIAATVGDTLRWRVVNASARDHPMHLHGFYFRVDSHGGEQRDSIFAPDQRQSVVTDNLPALHTTEMTWVPTRPGNWLYHCHLGFHVYPEAARLEPQSTIAGEHASHGTGEHMAGLVLGITVAPRVATVRPDRDNVRRLRLVVDEGVRRHRAARSLGFVLQRGATVPAPDSVERVGSPLVLHRGEPTDITVVNELKEATGVHWHGIELESYSDGVVGWSGNTGRLAPLIAPHDSFVAHLTLPRAGTFIYHTHLNDFEQITSGLYGGIIVLERGARFDPRRDHLYVAGWDGPDDPPHVLVNGDTVAAPIEMKVGETHRIRIINIGVALRDRFVLRRDTTTASWRAVAKDGMTLPKHLATDRPANQLVAVGETFDFEITPPTPGSYRLAIERKNGTVAWRQPIDVH